jgi:hypothetical protein
MTVRHHANDHEIQINPPSQRTMAGSPCKMDNRRG